MQMGERSPIGIKKPPASGISSVSSTVHASAYVSVAYVTQGWNIHTPEQQVLLTQVAG